MEMLYLSHMTAFKCIRELRYSPRYNDFYDKYNFQENRVSFNHKQVTSFSKIKFIDDMFSWINLQTSSKNLRSKIDVLISDQKLRYKTNKIHFHLCSMKLPKKLFIKLDNSVAISGPELVFFQLAEFLTFEQLVMVGLELCGTYVPSNDDGFDVNVKLKGFIDHCCPATSVERLRHLEVLLSSNIKQGKGIFRGIKKARQALKCIGNNAASPRESQIFALLNGPRAYGLFDVGNLKMNYKIDLSSKAQSIAGQKYAVADICSVKHRFIVEYDSRMYHEEIVVGQKDKRRAGALQHDKWNIISIVPDQLRNPEVIYHLAIYMLKSMHKSPAIAKRNFYDRFLTSFYAFMHVDLLL